MRNIVHNYDKAVFGSSIHAMMYAYVNQLPLFYSKLVIPKEIEFFSPSFSFMPTETIIKNDKEYVVGAKIKEFWQKMSFFMSLEGLMPLADNVVSARLEEDIIKFTTKNSRVINIKFNHLYMLDENIEGLPEIEEIKNEGLIYDHAKFDNVHEYKKLLIESEEDFVNQIWIDGNKLLIISKTDNILEDIPDYMIRFKVIEMAKSYGYKGKQNGIYHYRKELKIQRFKKLDLKMISREICKTSFNIYKPQSNLTFLQPNDNMLNELLTKFKPTRTWNLLS